MSARRMAAAVAVVALAVVLARVARGPRRDLAAVVVPPVGCADHRHGATQPCGPCATASIRRDQWIARQRLEAGVSARRDRFRWGLLPVTPPDAPDAPDGGAL